MPLMKKSSKKAFKHNVEAEMHAGKPQNQALAIAYSVKRKNAKKMAKGGQVPQSAAQDEKRPMPDQVSNDSKDVMRADHKKANGQDNWLDKPTVKQAQMNNGRAVKPIKYPAIKGTDGVFQVRLRDEEDDLQKSASPANPDEQPVKDLDEEDAKKEGKSPDMAAPHNDEQRKAYAKGGMINEEVSFHDSEEDEDPDMSPIRESYNSPAEDEFMAEHFAEGGEVSPEDEEEIEHAASIAAAIMARRKMARGGEILSEDSMESDDSDMVDLDRNAEEDANMEDKASFDALRKENYSESSALRKSQPIDSNEHSPEHDEEDVDDRSMVDAIRRKMKAKSPISR